MHLPLKIKKVTQLFVELEDHIASFKNPSKLSCLTGCGKCCTKPDIEATILEFMPFAFELFSRRLHFNFLEKLEQHTGSICMLLSPFTENGAVGHCTEYAGRGLICRLFGFSTSRDKYGQLQLVTCKTIKAMDTYSALENNRELVLMAPVISDYYSKLARIDFMLGSRTYPINTAIAKAVQEVMHYYTYRRPPLKAG